MEFIWIWNQMHNHENGILLNATQYGEVWRIVENNWKVLRKMAEVQSKRRIATSSEKV
jgi:hypothetical protein